MQKKLTILFAFAIFVLVLGWAITPAQANPPDPNGKHDHGGGGGGANTDFVDLIGGMETSILPVTVSRDSPKMIHFGDTNFDHTISMRFQNIDPEMDCVGTWGDVMSDDLDAVAKELAETLIPSGFFVAEMDKKNATGIIFFQYNSENLGNGTAITLSGPIGFMKNTFLFEPGTSTITVKQSNGSGLTDNKTVACESPSFVNLILTQQQ